MNQAERNDSQFPEGPRGPTSSVIHYVYGRYVTKNTIKCKLADWAFEHECCVLYDLYYWLISALAGLVLVTHIPAS